MRDESIENSDSMKLNLIFLKIYVAIMIAHPVVLHAMKSQYKCALDDIQNNETVPIHHDIGFG